MNCLLAMAGIWVGAYLTWFQTHYYAPAIVSMAAFLVCAAGNIVNDCVDIEIDRINQPNRVLVRGALSTRYALVLSIVFNLAALLLAISVSWDVTVLALISIGLLYLYNYILKKVPIAGNIVISFLAGLTFITGGVAIDPQFAFELPGPLIGFAFAFLFHFVREVVKDVQDMEGDRAVGLRTLPHVIGPQKSLMIALIVFLILTVLTFLPALAGWFGSWYKIIAVYIVELPILAFLIFVWGNPTRRMLSLAAGALKAGMVLGLLALILA